MQNDTPSQACLVSRAAVSAVCSSAWSKGETEIIRPPSGFSGVEKNLGRVNLGIKSRTSEVYLLQTITKRPKRLQKELEPAGR